MAGPLRPRCVMRIFSRKVGVVGLRLRPVAVGFVDARASVETPERSHQRAWSCGLRVKGTRAGRGSTRLRWNWRAMS